MSKLIWILSSLVLLAAVGELSESDKAQLKTIRETLKSAGASYRQNELSEAKASLTSAKQQLDTLSTDSETQKAARPLLKSWAKARQLVDAKLDQVDEKLSADTRVSFAGEIAPKLADRCIGCHSDSRARQELQVHTFAGLRMGSENGEVVDTSDAENSLIILKLKGEADGDRMPPNGEPFSDEFIATFTRWISEGAKFDGQDATAPLVKVIQSNRRAKLSADELTKAAKDAAQKNWSLAFPGRKLAVHTTDNFLLVSSPADAGKSESLGKQAEEKLSDAIKLLGLPKDTSVKGALTIYNIPRQYDFAEWTQMVEKRTASKKNTMHWRSDGGLGYVILGPNTVSEKNFISDETKLLQNLTAVLLGRWGAPAWYADGRGLYSLGQTNRRDPRARSWKGAAVRVLPQVKSVKEIFDASLPTDQSDVASWAFATFLASDRRRTNHLHARLRAGDGFDATFTRVYGDSVEKIGNAWLDSFRPKKLRKKR